MHANQTSPGQDQRDTTLVMDPNAVCEECGCFGAFHFDGRTLCAECYTGCGSCCPEFGKDDLWPSEADEKNEASSA